MNQNRIDIEPVRLNRFLAMLGVGSRRACDDLIKSGKVKVDGRSVNDPTIRVFPGQSTVSLGNTPLENPPRAIVLLLNKPTGFVSTVSDPAGRPTVIDLCKSYTRKRRLFPVGRLDINTTGAILLTNDGMLCYRLTHPRFQIPRIYHVRVRGFVDEKKIRALERLSRSKDARPSVLLTKTVGKVSILKITLREGRNRQVRRMCKTVGLHVVGLKRVQFGPITIRKLPLGGVRPLEARELDKLRRMTS